MGIYKNPFGFRRGITNNKDTDEELKQSKKEVKDTEGEQYKTSNTIQWSIQWSTLHYFLNVETPSEAAIGGVL